MSSQSSTRAAALAIRASTSVTAAPKAQARHAINGPVLSHTNHHRDTHQRSQNDDRSRRLFSTSSSRLQDQSYPSNISRREPNYPGHIPLNAFETGLMSVGSAIASLINPGRPDMIAALTETSTFPSILPFLPRLRSRLLSTPAGRRILRERPLIHSSTLDLEKMKTLEKGTMGRNYVEWLEKWGVSPDTREPVRFIDDPELAYVVTRYRQSHDFFHVLLGFPVSLPGETVVKWFEFANMGLPVALLASIGGPLRLASGRRSRLWKAYGRWALETGSSCELLLSVEWEKVWDVQVKDLRGMLGIVEPPIEWDDWWENEKAIRRVEKAEEEMKIRKEEMQNGLP